ncbi:hypothetical protein Bbelb_431760 [Branchiostoma belcheri]|nr:hypothetical protein Bbelb_431760 [Branchiostoma belcheri]
MDVEMQEDSVRSDLLEKTNDKPPTVFLAVKGDSGDLSNIADTNFSCWNSPCPISPNASGCQLKWKVSGSKGELERSQVKRRGSQVEGKPVEDLGCDDVEGENQGAIRSTFPEAISMQRLQRRAAKFRTARGITERQFKVVEGGCKITG